MNTFDYEYVHFYYTGKYSQTSIKMYQEVIEKYSYVTISISLIFKKMRLFHERFTAKLVYKEMEARTWDLVVFFGAYYFSLILGLMDLTSCQTS